MDACFPKDLCNTEQVETTYEYDFDGDYSSIYNSDYKSNYTAAHENVDITHFVFQADEFISMGAAISEDFVWITNPSCDGETYVWNNRAGDQYALNAVFDSDGYSINYFEVGANSTDSTSCSVFDEVYFDNWESIEGTNTMYVSGQIDNPDCDGENFVWDDYTGNPINITAIYTSAGYIESFDTPSGIWNLTYDANNDNYTSIFDSNGTEYQFYN